MRGKRIKKGVPERNIALAVDKPPSFFIDGLTKKTLSHTLPSMPITQSAKKALRQSKRRYTRNLKRKEAFRSALKKIKTLIAEKKFNEAKKLIPQAYKSLDKAAKTNAIKKNTASRKKSRLMNMIKKTAVS